MALEFAETEPSRLGEDQCDRGIMIAVET
jgi:hypothetical protein